MDLIILVNRLKFLLFTPLLEIRDVFIPLFDF
jgi:hypothetical protein